MTKRVLAFLMVIAMVFSLIPTVVVAEETEATPGYKMILQKAHNQAADLTVEVYLQANTAEQGAVTGYQFDVAVADGLALEAAKTDVGGLLKASGISVLADPAAVSEIEVGNTNKVLIATVDLAGEVPADWTTAFGLTNVEVTTAAGTYSDGGAAVTQPGAEGYAGAVTVDKIPFTACEAHTGTWTAGLPATAGTLAAGNYYLTDNVQLTGTLNVAKDAKVTVCLNGYDITAKDATRMFELTNAGATLNICDCTATGEGKDYTAGMLIPKHNQGGALRSLVAENVTINFYGGIIDGTNSTKLEASVALIVGSTLNMLGGKVQNFDAGKLSSGNNYGPIIVRGKKDSADGVATIANVIFENCGSAMIGGAPGGTDRANGAVLTVENVTVLDSAAGARTIEIGTDRFKSVTLKGDCKFDAPVFVGEGETLTLALGANADVNIATADELTEEQFNEQVKLAEGGALTDGTLLYETAGVFVTYADGKFVFEEGHTIADKHAAGIVFKAWDKTDSLPAEGNWYLTSDVTVSDNQYVEGTLNLDLNGKTVTTTGGNIYRVYVGVLSIFDGTSQFDAEGNWTGVGTGIITGFNTKDVGMIVVNTGGTFNLYGGKLSGNSGNNGPALYMYATAKDTDTRKFNGGIFNMYGGEITGNTSTYYGPISVNDFGSVPEGKNRAEINIYGGKIYNNTSNIGLIRVPDDTDVTMSGGEISGNKAAYGGAFYMGGNSTLTITGGKISENSVTSAGGAIYASSTNVVTINGGEFLKNHADSKGGAIYAKDNVVITSAADAKPVFDGNTCTAGGGMLLAEGTYKISLTGATIKNNEGSAGGAININSGNTGAELTLKDCLLTGNVATSSTGSAIAAGGSAVVTLDNTVITGNNCGNGSAWYNAGAVYVINNRLIVSGATVIAGNTATKGTGAKAGWQNLLMRESRKLSTFIEVDELSAGAHIDVWNLGAKSFTADQVVQVVAGGSQTKWDCGWITYNESQTKQSSTASISENVSRVNGEFTFGHWHEVNGQPQEYTAISSADELTAATANYYYLAADVSTSASWSPADGVVLCFNGHKITGSARPVVSLEGTAAKTTVTFEDCTGVTLENDEYIGGGITTTTTVSGSGHGMRAAGSNVVNWNGGKIAGITVKATGAVGGAAIWINGATVHINGGAVCNNTITTTGTSTIQGIVQINGGTLDINGGSFYGNTTSSGGIAYGVVRRAGGTVTMDNAKFFDNTAGTGAAAYTSGTINNCEFRNNSVSDKGGAVRASGSLTLNNCKFTENVATNGAGAVFTESTTLTMTGCEFTGNEATGGRGGAVDATNGSGNYTITDCVFKDNSASANGGALNVESAKTVNIKGTKFDGNTATSLGGAICTRGNGMTMNIAKNDSGVGCTFTGNSAAKGGAINFDTYHRYTNTRNISDATFTGNTATGGGGAVYINCGSHASNTGVLTMNVTSSTFTGNKASDGSAFSLNGYTVTNMDSCTFTGNESTAIYYGTIFMQTANTKLTLKGLMTMTGNTNKAGDADMYLNVNGTYNAEPSFVDLDPASRIGVNAAPDYYKNHPVVGAAALKADAAGDINGCFFSNAPDRFRTYVNGEGNLVLTNYVAEDGTTYQTLSEAITAAANAGETAFKVQVGSTEEIELPAAITQLDLNGANVAKVKVAEGKTLTLIDTATNDYDISDGVYGKVAVEGTVAPNAKVNGKQYIVINDGNGNYSAHRVYASILSRVLRPAANGAGFKAIFAADEAVTADVKYGIKFSWDKAEGWLPAAFTEMEAGLPGGTTTPNQKVVSVKNIVTAEDNTHWGATLYGVPYVTVNGVEITGAEQTLVMQTLADKALAALNAEDEVYQQIEAMMAKCGIN